MFALMDTLRKAQGEALEGLGFGPTECGYHVVASGMRWRLRAYGGPDGRPSLLIVTAPIKRPYLWDLAPSVSAVRYCLHQGLRVYLLEWTPPSSESGNAGLAEYASHAAIGRSGPAFDMAPVDMLGVDPKVIGAEAGQPPQHRIDLAFSGDEGVERRVMPALSLRSDSLSYLHHLAPAAPAVPVPMLGSGTSSSHSSRRAPSGAPPLGAGIRPCHGRRGPFVEFRSLRHL